jgi:hypothetical protein
VFFIIAVSDYMRKTIRQREDQIAQMDRFLELYKKANGLNATRQTDDGSDANGN